MKFIFGIGVVALVLAIAATFAWFHNHPCIRYGAGTCGGYLRCAAYNTNMSCMVWLWEEEYPCRVCVERK